MKKKVSITLTEKSQETIEEFVQQMGSPVTHSGLCAWIIDHCTILRGDTASIMAFCAERSHGTSAPTINFLMEENRRLRQILHQEAMATPHTQVR